MKNKEEILIKSIQGINMNEILYSYPEESWNFGGIAKSRYKYSSDFKKDSDLRNASSAKICNTLQNFVDSEISTVIDKYAKDNDINIVKKQYQIARYKEGQFFKEHVDKTEEYPRKISALFYLNDDYLGGSLKFTKLGISIKPKKNTLIIFPSSEDFSHSAEPVESGIKYVVVGFML